MASDQITELNGISILFKQRLAKEKGQAPADPDFRKQYPLLFGLLSDNRVDEKTVGDYASVRFSNNGGDWLVCLYVPTVGASAEILVSSVSEIFPQLEKALAGGQCPWKHNMKRPPRNRKLESEKK